MSWATDLVDGMRANLAPEVASRPPEGQALGYGVDLWCTSSVTQDLREVDPESPLGIALLALRSITTPRDSAPDAPGRGTDVKLWLSKGVTRGELRAYEGMLTGEIEQDDRIETVELSCTLEGSIAVPAMRIAFVIHPKGADQPFAGVFVVPATGAAMLELLP